MTPELLAALEKLFGESDAQKYAILLRMLWRIAEQDWHGASDDCNDLRELGL